MSRVVAMAAGLLALALPRIAPAEELDELVRRADMVLRGKTSAGVFDMDIKTSDYQRKYSIVMWYDGTGQEHVLLKILGPALWRGHGTLKVGNQLKLYNPRTNHVTVVSHSMLGDSWMGSHFTNDDLVKETQLAEHYDLKLLRKWTADNELGHSVTFYRAKLTPKPSAPVAWGKIVYELWTRGKVVIPARADYYRKSASSRPDRELTFSGLTKMDERLVPTVMKMTLAKKPGEHTAIAYKKLKFDLRIPGSKFTEQALRR